jgi:hypothetical protein
MLLSFENFKPTRLSFLVENFCNFELALKSYIYILFDSTHAAKLPRELIVIFSGE